MMLFCKSKNRKKIKNPDKAEITGQSDWFGLSFFVLLKIIRTAG
jgi:hypothetical protein